jgi:DNA-binding NarL/FixJ family response regulator
LRSVLVCVRTTVAAQTIASCATRLGLGGAIRTALSGVEALARLAESPADIVFADTALTRPDTVGFTRRVRERSPGAVIMLIGAEEPAVAQAAVAAGARGVIRPERDDLLTSVTKSFMLLVQPVRPAAVPQQRIDLAPAPAAVSAEPANGTYGGGPADYGPNGVPGQLPGVGLGPDVGHPANGLGQSGPIVGQVGGAMGGAVGAPHPGYGNARSGPVPGGVAANAHPGSAPGQLGHVGVGNGGPATAGQANAGPGTRRLSLTERELQVLRRMADGKSNAEIGRELYVSEDTVKTHARRLFRKLGARDRAHAVAAAFRQGLVS